MLGHMKDEDTAAVLAEELKDSNVKGSIGDWTQAHSYINIMIIIIITKYCNIV